MVLASERWHLTWKRISLHTAAAAFPLKTRISRFTAYASLRSNETSYGMESINIHVYITICTILICLFNFGLLWTHTHIQVQTHTNTFTRFGEYLLSADFHSTHNGFMSNWHMDKMANTRKAKRKKWKFITFVWVSKNNTHIFHHFLAW